MVAQIVSALTIGYFSWLLCLIEFTIAVAYGTTLPVHFAYLLLYLLNQPFF